MERAYARYSATLLDVEKFLEDAKHRQIVERYREHVLHVQEALKHFRTLFFQHYEKVGPTYREFRVQATRRVDTDALLTLHPALKDELTPTYSVNISKLEAWLADGKIGEDTYDLVVSESPTQLKGGSAAHT